MPCWSTNGLPPLASRIVKRYTSVRGVTFFPLRMLLRSARVAADAFRPVTAAMTRRRCCADFFFPVSASRIFWRDAGVVRGSASVPAGRQIGQPGPSSAVLGDVSALSRRKLDRGIASLQHLDARLKTEGE